jgi:hypothetical protein
MYPACRSSDDQVCGTFSAGNGVWLFATPFK